MRHVLRSVLLLPKTMFNDFLLFNLECCKCARMRFHYANALVVLCICAVAHIRGNTDREALVPSSDVYYHRRVFEPLQGVLRSLTSL